MRTGNLDRNWPTLGVQSCWQFWFASTAYAQKAYVSNRIAYVGFMTYVLVFTLAISTLNESRLVCINQIVHQVVNHATWQAEAKTKSQSHLNQLQIKMLLSEYPSKPIALLSMCSKQSKIRLLLLSPLELFRFWETKSMNVNRFHSFFGEKFFVSAGCLSSSTTEISRSTSNKNYERYDLVTRQTLASLNNVVFTVLRLWSLMIWFM